MIKTTPCPTIKENLVVQFIDSTQVPSPYIKYSRPPIVGLPQGMIRVGVRATVTVIGNTEIKLHVNLPASQNATIRGTVLYSVPAQKIDVAVTRSKFWDIFQEPSISALQNFLR
jgi:hypothetical protein